MTSPVQRFSFTLPQMLVFSLSQLVLSYYADTWQSPTGSLSLRHNIKPRPLLPQATSQNSLDLPRKFTRCNNFFMKAFLFSFFFGEQHFLRNFYVEIMFSFLFFLFLRTTFFERFFYEKIHYIRKKHKDLFFWRTTIFEEFFYQKNSLVVEKFTTLDQNSLDLVKIHQA